MSQRSKKILSCLFLPDVLCSFRKNDKFVVLDRCLKCPHYREFEREMDEEDAREMAEIDRIRKYGYSRGID